MDQTVSPHARARERLAGIDGLRWFLCFAVALLHSIPGDAGRTTVPWATLLASPCRAAVPFFFIASGYFMPVPKAFTSRTVARPLIRLLPVYLAWFLIYAVVNSLLFHHPINLTIMRLLTGGPAFHLWFIPVLGVVLAAAPIGIIVLGLRATAAIAAALALLGLMFGAYHELFHLRAIAGTRLMMAPALIMIGYGMARGGVRLSILQASGATLIALVLSIAEEAIIAWRSSAAFTSHDIVFMTYPLGVAIFLLALGIGSPAGFATVQRLGQISLGVYASHLLFIWLLLPWIGNGTPVRACALAVAAVLMATGLSLSLDRIPWLRKLVR